MNIALGLALAVMLVVVQACNEDKPSGFTGSTKSDNAAGNQDPKKSGNPGKGSDGGGTDGTGTGGSGGSESDSSGDSDAAGGTPDGGPDSDGNDLTVDEAAIVAEAPGVAVDRYGVNFEDYNDSDFNDAVLCFEGKFKVDKSKVFSIRNQKVEGNTFSNSICEHNMTLQIIHKDGSKEPELKFTSRSKTPLLLNFKVGSRMELFMTPTTEPCRPGVRRSMHDSSAARVQPNVCNKTGS